MPDTSPLLFISHATWSEQGSDRSRAVLNELYLLLNGEWEVFIDKERLRPGDRWRPKILQNLAQAQAGVILFDKRAVTESCWVKAEALLLCFRRSINPDFQLIPVLLDGLTIKHTCFNDYEPFELNAINVVLDKDAQRAAREFAQEVAAGLDLRKAKMASEELRGWPSAFEGLIASHLYVTLSGAWCALTDSVPRDWAGLDMDEGRMRRAVAQLMDLRHPLETIEAVKELVKQEIDKTRMWSLLKSKCVENESVELIFNSGRDPDRLGLRTYLTCDVKGLGPIETLFARLDVESPRNLTVRPITVNEDAPETLEGMIEHIDRTIKGKLSTVVLDIITGNPQRRFSEVARQRLRDQIFLVVCYVPAPLANAQVLRVLRERYKKIVFLVQLSSPKEVLKFKALGGTELTPALTDEKLSDFDLLDDLLKNINFEIKT